MMGVASQPEPAPLALNFAWTVTVYTLCGVYAAVAIVPLIQLVRIRVRVPALGWTSQKLFLTLVLLQCIMRSIFFALVPSIRIGSFMLADFTHPVFTVLEDFPTIFYCSTFTLLILFWAEIINHARSQSASLARRLRIGFLVANIFAYVTQITVWLLLFFLPAYTRWFDVMNNAFQCSLSFAMAGGFLYFGGSLYKMLSRMAESHGRQNKLFEVGSVATISAVTFSTRAVMEAFGTFEVWIDYNAYWIAGFFVVAEILPCLLVMWILRKLPAPRDQPAHAKLLDEKSVTTRVNKYSSV